MVKVITSIVLSAGRNEMRTGLFGANFAADCAVT